MKQISVLLITVSILLFVNGCKKNTSAPADTNTGGSSSGSGSSVVTLLGKWLVIKDSIVVNNFRLSNGSIPVPGVYYGTPNDYWLFNADSTVYIYEGLSLGTTPYQLIPPDKLLIPAMEVGNLNITTLTSTNFTWDLALTSSNGGTYYRRAYFKR